MKDHKTRFFDALGITPGPWWHEKEQDGGRHFVAWEGTECDDTTICTANNGGCDGLLIAASPEMLLGLIDMVFFWQEQFCVEDCDIGAELNPCLDVLATIEAATGRTWAEVKRIYEQTKD